MTQRLNVMEVDPGTRNGAATEDCETQGHADSHVAPGVTVQDRLFVRVERTFAFFDLCGFTTFTDVVGEDEAVEVLNHFRTETRRACWAHHVRIVKWLGDGVMLAASRARSVITAAVELDAGLTTLGAPLLVRGGIARGPVVLIEDDDYVGRAVNLAARLSECATPGTILVTAELAGDAPSWASVQPVAGRAIRGFSGARNLVSIHAPTRSSGEGRVGHFGKVAFGAGAEM